MINLRGLAAIYKETFYYFYERILEATKLTLTDICSRKVGECRLLRDSTH